MSQLLAELKRRNVIRMAGLYLVGGWLVVQVAGTLLPVFEAPSWVMKTLVGLLAVGFVPALIFAWVFELTPEGIKRDAEVRPEESIAPQTARRMDRMIIVVLIIAIIYFGFDKFVLAPRREAALVATATQAVKAEARVQAKPEVDRKSVAVLPFVNMSGDPNNEYFSDGITEEILNALAQIPGLKVAARTSAFAFKGKDPDLRQVGEVLDVATVLEGSVQRAGDAVRITAQLIDTRSGYHLWSEKYDRKLTSIFAVEDEISKAIADKLQVQLAGGNALSLVAQKEIDPRAHDLYLRGLTLLAARTVAEAIDVFQQAVAIDPNYAQAWAALAEAQALLPAYVTVPIQDADARSLDAARHALALNPDVALAHVAQGIVYSNQMRWADADRSFRRALTLAPGDAEAMDQYAQFLYGVGQLEPALAELERALQRDPLSGVSGAVRAQILFVLHRDAAALKQIESTLAAHPYGLLEHRIAVWVYLSLHRYADAEQQMRMVSQHDPDVGALLVRGMADPSQRASAVHALETSSALARFRRDAIVHALFLAALGENDRALAVLEEFAINRNSTTSQLLWYPVFDPLRANPRFKAVLKKIGLPYTPAGTVP